MWDVNRKYFVALLILINFQLFVAVIQLFTILMLYPRQDTKNQVNEHWNYFIYKRSLWKQERIIVPSTAIFFFCRRKLFL